jgi:hypothetical protein
MGREARRSHLQLEELLGETFWGYLLDAIPCKSCNETGKQADGEGHCVVCEGEGNVYPKVTLPSYPVKEFPYEGLEYFENEYGWQMWETTSEGSPMSPVFKTPEELARWLADTGASAFAGMTATYDEWLGTITVSGGAPSAVLTVDSTGKERMESGVAALSQPRSEPKDGGL